VEQGLEENRCGGSEQLAVVDHNGDECVSSCNGARTFRGGVNGRASV
jgi:hypothetical protein